MVIATCQPPAFPPYPWTIRAANRRTYPQAQILDSNGVELAAVCGFTPSEADRTAQLIAATPDLLFACREVLVADDHHEVARICQAAIWRAEGSIT